MNVKLWISIIISLVFIVLIGFEVDFNKTQQAIRNADYTYLLIAVASSIFTNIFRTYRWKYIINPVKKISTQSLFSGVAIGYMANNLLPARLGEFIRAYIMGKKEKISKSATLATILLERIFDGLALLLFLGVITLLFSLPTWINQAGIAATAFFLLLSGLLLLLMIKKEKGIKLVQKTAGLISARLAKEAGRLLNHFLTGLVVINHKRNLFFAFLCSVIVWLTEAVTYYLIILSFGINLPPYVPLLVMVIVNIGILIPSAPGYIGAFEFFCISSLAIFSIEKSVALSFGIVLHAVLFVPITAIGIFYFYKENLNFAEVTSVSKLPPSGV